MASWEKNTTSIRNQNSSRSAVRVTTVPTRETGLANSHAFLNKQRFHARISKSSRQNCIAKYFLKAYFETNFICEPDMGNFRSRSGCLTCRARRVKCDETRPVCKACSKKNRPCQWETPQNKFKSYNPEGQSSSSTSGNPSRNELSGESMDIDGNESSQASRAISPREHGIRNNYRTESRSETLPGSLTSSNQPSPGSSYPVPGSRTHSETDVPLSSLLRLDGPGSAGPFRNETIALNREEAVLVHHFTEVLGRWLDCTDATRQFTLGVPEKIKSCPILCHAVLCFAARHRKNDEISQTSYQKCIELLIERLNEENASHNETLLCAIVILRFYEQLNVPTGTGSDDEQHLAGTSAILRASQGYHFVDPSAPTLREAAFWVYVRQCLYNATINQQSPDIDFSLRLHPKPGSMQDSHPLARLRLETGWANQMTWNLACVVNFCFDSNDQPSDRTQRSRIWQELWDEVQQWHRDRPKGFDAIFHGVAGQDGVFPEIWFAADWHVISFGFYNFACILLLTYKPGPKFAIRNINRLSDAEFQILEHARLICGAAKSSPGTVPLTIVLCHTIFIWGPLVTDPREQDEIVQLLITFEDTHLWPTTWIINALRQQWGLEE